MLFANEKLKKLKEKVERAISEYNKYRSPEFTAYLIDIKENELIVAYTWHGCATCGLYDYFEDLIYNLEEVGIKAKIKEIKEEENGFVVIYQI